MVTDAQREIPVDAARMAQVARGAVRRLHIRTRGTLSITFIDSRRMRTLNKRFLRHDRATDVLSFRYDGEPACLPPHALLRKAKQRGRRQVVGEIVIAPAQAQAYARTHKIPYQLELSRYVVHGILHWLGYEDRTAAQQRQMRKREDELLLHCAAWLRARGSGLGAVAHSPQPTAHSQR